MDAGLLLLVLTFRIMPLEEYAKIREKNESKIHACPRTDLGLAELAEASWREGSLS